MIKVLYSNLGLAESIAVTAMTFMMCAMYNVDLELSDDRYYI